MSHHGMPSSFEDVREKLFAIRCRSKQGQALSPEEMRFCETCLRRWPDEYAAMNMEILEATAPFGSRVHISPRDSVLAKHPKAKAERSGPGWAVTAPTLREKYEGESAREAWARAAASLENNEDKTQ